MTDISVTGKYCTGHGVARRVNSSPVRMAQLSSCFGSPAIGTFNVSCEGEEWNNVVFHAEKARIGFWSEKGRLKKRSFFFCILSNSSGEEVPCWAYNWGPVRDPKHGAAIELFSKGLIPDSFKTGQLSLLFPEKWTKSQIDSWWPDKCKWFQSFSWGPKRADGMLVWKAFSPLVRFGNSTVLDIGCNTGWYSFMASKSGARVHAYDTAHESVEIARQIRNHIEWEDVYFGESDPGGPFDYIFYLSVHHQIDPDYKTLESTLGKLKKRCYKLILELIVPSIGGKVSAREVDKIVGVKPILSYDHAVRCHRNVYVVRGAREKNCIWDE